MSYYLLTVLQRYHPVNTPVKCFKPNKLKVKKKKKRKEKKSYVQVNGGLEQ